MDWIHFGDNGAKMAAVNFVCPMTIKERFRAAFILYRAYFWKFMLLYLGLAVLALVISVVNTFLQNVLNYRISTAFLYSLLFTPLTILASTAGVIAASNAVLKRPVKAVAAYRRAFSLRIALCVLVSVVPLWIWYLIYALILEYLLADLGSIQPIQFVGQD